MKLFNRRNLMLAGAIGFAAALTAGALISGSADAAVETGAPAPAFSVQDASGRTRSLSEFAGRTVVIEWTNKDCPYVRKHYNSGNMQALQTAAAGQGAVWLTVISSAQGEQGYLTGAAAAAHAQEVNATPAAILIDASGAMGRAYGARNTPQMFVINAQQRVVYQGAIDDRPSAAPSSLQGATNYVTAALADLRAGRAVQVAETTPYGCTVKYRN
ncbi:MAG: redoxin family protein [Hyphomonadaceae bacterium]|nr:redoxin family protein [Hyphomonadaceae bacterium]